MKTYNVKYEVGQDVYILLSKKIFKSKIEKIRIIHSSPYVKGETMEEMDGIEIDYLLIVDEKIFSSGGYSYLYDWYKQDDIFLNKDDLLRNIV